MISRLLRGFIADTLSFLDSHRNFFAASAEEKKKLLEALSLPKPLTKALASCSEEQFLKELEILTNFLSGDTTTGLFHAALGIVCAKELGDMLDGVHKVTYSGQFGQELQAIVTQYTYQEAAIEVQEFLEQCTAAPYIVIQSPFGLSKEMRHEMRAHFQKEHKLCFPVFSVNKQLIGGIRVFIDGETKDLSWISRINALSNLLSSRV